MLATLCHTLQNSSHKLRQGIALTRHLKQVLNEQTTYSTIDVTEQNHLMDFVLTWSMEKLEVNQVMKPAAKATNFLTKLTNSK